MEQGDPSQRRGRTSVDDLIEQVTGKLREHESLFSQRSYSDQPILRTGADLARAQQRAQARELAAQQRAQARQTRQAHGGPSWPTAGATTAASAPRHAPASARQTTSRTPTPYDSVFDVYADAPSFAAADPEEVELPDVLQRLRDLAHQRDETGAPLRGGALFCAQARLAADFEDDLPFTGYYPYRYLPTYQDISNRELRGYFTWRAGWRHGTATDAPATFATLLAFELVNGVGATSPQDAFDQLSRLGELCQQMDAAGRFPSVTHSVQEWTRDYAVVHGLDAQHVMPEDERRFCYAVTTLRRAEAAQIAAKGLRGKSPDDAPAMPSDEDVFHAMGEVSTIDLERSPLFRKYPESSAHVCAAVFRRMAEHCARRRKTNYVDGLVGYPYATAYYPFVGVPLGPAEDGPDPVGGRGDGADRTIRLAPGATISHRFDRWTRRLPYEYFEHSRELARLLRSIDRQMRIEWKFSRPLKDQGLPQYLQRFVVEEAQAQKEREEEAERRRFTVDLSQLGHIRSASATTREALLVDEEREGYLPGDTTEDVAPTPATPPPPQVASGPEPASGAATAHDVVPAPAVPATAPGPQPTTAPAAAQPAARPYDLDDTELAVARALLRHEDPTPHVPVPGPTLDMVVDSINEKLFDLEGDVTFEYDGDAPQPVEDYEEDLRGALLS